MYDANSYVLCRDIFFEKAALLLGTLQATRTQQMCKGSTSFLQLLKHICLLGNCILNMIFGQAPIPLLEHLIGLTVAAICVLTLSRP